MNVDAIVTNEIQIYVKVLLLYSFLSLICFVNQQIVQLLSLGGLQHFLLKRGPYT